MQKKQVKKTVAQPTPLKQTEKLIPKSWVYLFTGLFAFLLYINTIGHDYTVDDATVIKNNKFTTAGISSIGKIFTSAYRAGFWNRNDGLYRPVSVAMFAIEWQLAPEKPWLGHLINILLYTFTALITLTVLQRLLKSLHPLIPLLATFLFIAHPLHTEVVANIKSRDELLSFLFGISALYGLIKSIETGKKIWLIISFLFYFIALLSKESAITWLGVFPLALWCCIRMDLKKTILATLPYLGFTILFLFIRYQVLGSTTGNSEIMLINNSLVASSSQLDRFATSIYILGKYLWLLFFPVTLVFDYSFNTIPLQQLGSINFILPFLIYVSVLILALRRLKNRELLSFAILFFLGTLSVVANVLFLLEATMAERFLYTPSLGFCMATMIFVASFTLKKSNKTGNNLSFEDFQKNSKLLFPVFIVLILFSFKTIARNTEWKNNLTLLEKDSKNSPNSARICYAYGSAILIEKALNEKDKEKKDVLLDQSIELLKKGVSIIPNYNDAWYHLGVAYKEKNDAKNAIAAFEQARAYKAFDEAGKFTSSGIAYGMAGQYDKAISDLKNAILLDSTSADAWNNIGLYMSEAGQHEESLKAFEQSLRLKKDFDKAYYNRGNAWAKMQQFNLAIEDYKKAIALNPDYSDAYNNIGNCYAALRSPADAKPWFEKAVQKDPTNAKAVLNLGITLQILGDSVASRQLMDRARSMGAGL